MSAVWTIQNMTSVPLYEGKQDVVATVTVLVTDVSSYGQIVGIDYSNVGNEPNFTPWDQLTQDEVLTWTKASLGAERVAKIEADVALPIPEPTPQPPIPWGN